MDRSVPAAAATLLLYIYKTETGKTPPDCYEVIYGHNQDKLPKPITQMTLDDVEAAQPNWTKRFGSSAAGAAQFMRNTLDKPNELRDIEGEMGLTGKEKFSPNLQDRMAYHLLKRRGYLEFMAGDMSVTDFGKRLAMEWASFPALTTTQGAHRRVTRGQSYYAGDGVNKSLVKPEDVEAVLAGMLDGDMGEVRIAPEPAPVEQRSDPVGAIADAATVSQVQARLFALGYTEVGSRRPDGSFDGKSGDMTKAATMAFRNDNGLPVVDYIDMAMLVALMTAKPRELPAARTEAKPSEVREQVPEAKAAWWTQIGAYIMAAGSGIWAFASGILDQVDGARGFLEPVKQFALDVPPWVYALAIFGVAVFLWQKSQQAQKASVEAFKTGERR